MNALFTLLVGNAVIALALALIALAAGWLHKPAVAHVVWVLVLIRLLTPPIVPVEGRWGTKIADRTSATVANAVSVEPEHQTSTTPAAPRDVLIPSHAETAKVVTPARSPTPVRTEEVTLPIVTVRQRIPLAWMLGGAWVLGSLIYAISVVRCVRRFCDLLQQAAPAERAIMEIVRDIGGTMGDGRAVEVRVLNAAVSPMMLWWGRAVLVLPRSVVEHLSAQQQRAIVAHELAHLRRGDHWVRWLEVVTTALLWWHPLVWLARHGLHETEEQCCDAWVVATLSSENDARRTYADALVDVLELTCGITQPLPVGASGLGRMKHLRRRLVMILDRTPEKSVSRMGKGLIVALVAMLPLAPIRAEDRATPKSGQASAATSPVSDSTRKAIESLLETAQDPNDQVRGAAMEAIVRFGPQAVPVLIDALGRDKDGPLAQSLLPSIGIDGIEGLIETIDSPAPPAARERALLAVEGVLLPGGAGGMGETGGAAPGVFEGRGAAPVAFGAAGAQPLMFSGTVGLANPAPNVMTFALWTIAPAAKASTDANAAVRRAAVRVLGAISNITFDPAVAKALAAALKDEDPSVRRVAAGAMVNVARFAPEVASTLAAGVNDPDQSVRVSAINALGSLGSRGKQSMPVLIAALKDADPAVRIAAARALGAMQVPQQFNLVAAVNPGANGIPAGMPPPVANPDGSFALQATRMPPAPGSPDVWVYAQNIWHWAKLGRYDQAKAEADQIIKTDEATLLNAFTQVAQERNENLGAWLKRNAEVKELKELVTQLNKAIKDSRPPGSPQSPSTQATFEDFGAAPR